MSNNAFFVTEILSYMQEIYKMVSFVGNKI